MSESSNITYALKSVFEEYGYGIIKERQRFRSLLSDFLPSQVKERRWLEAAVGIGIMDKLVSTVDLPSEEQDRMAKIALHDLTYDAGIELSVACNVIKWIADALAIFSSIKLNDINSVQITNDITKKVFVTPINEVSLTMPGVDSLMKRGYLFLEDSNWKQADDYFERVLDIDPEYSPAYVGKLCAEFKVRREVKIVQTKEPISESNNFQKAMRFADVNYRKKLDEYDRTINKCIELKKQALQQNRKLIAKFEMCISAGGYHNVGLKTDGTVVATGYVADGQGNIKHWRNIIAVSTGIRHTVGLKTDGTVIAVGKNDRGQCNTRNWQNIVAISAGAANGSHTVGLKANNTVVAVGNNIDGQCNTQNWVDITMVSAGSYHTVGLKVDGTVVTIGYKKDGQCDTQEWRNVVAVFAGNRHTVGLRADGTVVAAGKNDYGQCNTQDWQNIIAVSAGYAHTIGLKDDGTLVSVGFNKDDDRCNIHNWRNIVAISAGRAFSVGLKADGTVIAVGVNTNGQCNTYDWRNIGQASRIKTK